MATHACGLVSAIVNCRGIIAALVCADQGDPATPPGWAGKVAAGGWRVIPIDEVRRWLGGFDLQGDLRAEASRAATLALLAGRTDLPPRTAYDPGHVTASAVVLSADGTEVLLVFHPRLRRWLQPGGHLEDTDRAVGDAAAREVLEETGVMIDASVPPALAGVDVHEIPARAGEPAHLHHDLVFRMVASQREPIRPPRHEVVWCPVSDLDAYDADAPLRRAVERARRLPGLTPA